MCEYGHRTIVATNFTAHRAHIQMLQTCNFNRRRFQIYLYLLFRIRHCALFGQRHHKYTRAQHGKSRVQWVRFNVIALLCCRPNVYYAKEMKHKFSYQGGTVRFGSVRQLQIMNYEWALLLCLQ